MEVEYDRWGRMKYNPIFHQNTGKTWTSEDIQYLIDWYDIIGVEEMSFALSRTMGTIQNKVSALRKSNQMQNVSKKIHKPKEAHRAFLEDAK